MLKHSRPNSEINQRISALKASSSRGFRELLIEGGFDLANDLQFQNLSNLSFAGEDLRGIDFSGANLVGCDFTDALIDGAKFDRACLGVVQNGMIKYAQLERARDWVEYATNSADISPERDPGDSHLPIGAIFRDSPLLPPMVILPPSLTLSSYNTTALAVGIDAINETSFNLFRSVSRNMVMPSTKEMLKQVTEKSTRMREAQISDGEQYAQWASRIAGCRYRPLFQPAREKKVNDVHLWLGIEDYWGNSMGGIRPWFGWGCFAPSGHDFFAQFSNAAWPIFFDEWPIEYDEYEEMEESPDVAFRMVREVWR